MAKHANRVAKKSGGRRSSATDPAILFDLDGTLLDTVYRHVAAWSAALRTAGIVVSDWTIHRRIGMSGKSLVRQLLREQERPAKLNLEALEKEHARAFRALAGEARPLPGAQALLEFLSEHGVLWAIATTGNREQTKTLLKKLDIPRKAPVVTGDDVAKAKPSPDVFVAAAGRLRRPVADCIVVGDSVWDVLAAARKRALGVGLLCGGYSEEELQQAGAFRVYADPGDLLAHIEDLGISRE